MSDLYNIFKQNFPFCTRNLHIAESLLNSTDNKVIQKRNQLGDLMGVSVINKNNILMICVNKHYRNQGIGTDLLEKSEQYVKQQGYNEITIGVGDNYLMPGVPATKQITPEQMEQENIYVGLEENVDFFKKRRYLHKWDCNCFDMRMSLNDFAFNDITIPTKIDNVEYCWATLQDVENITLCVADAHEPFVKYYQNEKNSSFASCCARLCDCCNCAGCRGVGYYPHN